MSFASKFGPAPALLAACWFALIASAPMRAVAQEPAPLEMVGFRGASNLPVWVAQDKGFFAKNGVAIKLVATQGVAAQITDPREWELPNQGRVCLEDPETGEQYIVNTSHPAVRQQYAQRMSDRQDTLNRMLRKNGVERLDVRTNDDYVPALKAYFRSRKRRKRG